MNVTGIATSPTTATTAQNADNAAMGKEDFLKLLITQMQHQDPLAPMKNHEFVAQLATFSNVEQLISMNGKIDGLADIQGRVYASQATGLIGKDVEVRSNQVVVRTPGTPVQAAFQLQGDAATVTVRFRDAAGNPVRTLSLGPTAAGPVAVTWNGLSDAGVPVAPGTYTMDVLAATADGAPVTYEAQTRALVQGVTYHSGTPTLQMGDIEAGVDDVLGVYPASGN